MAAGGLLDAVCPWTCVCERWRWGSQDALSSCARLSAPPLRPIAPNLQDRQRTTLITPFQHVLSVFFLLASPHCPCNSTETKDTKCVASQTIAHFPQEVSLTLCLKISNAVYECYTYFMIWVLPHNWDVAYCSACLFPDTGKCLHVFLFYWAGLFHKVLPLLKINMIISETQLNAENTHIRIVLSASNNHYLWIKHWTVNFLPHLIPSYLAKCLPCINVISLEYNFILWIMAFGAEQMYSQKKIPGQKCKK